MGVDSKPSPRDFVSSSSLTSHTLPEGTRLHDYEINGLIGEGGFGIVYLAFDHSLGRRIAIKEYLPASMASRAQASSTVVLKSPRHEETFRLGLKSFVNEARLLARFDHPALVKVYRFWEENGTAYMAMPYYQGPTLKATLAELGRAPTEAELRGWLRPLLDALAVMHAAHCYHRDIAPDNILLTATGPLLLDFGAARRVIGDMTQALTVVLKPGFAPIEQYGEVPSLTQGAWTDLYALASVVYAAITGKAPISAVERLIDDRHVPLATITASTPGRYSESFVQAIDAALQLKPRDRPQTVAAFRALLDGEPADFGSHAQPEAIVSTFGSSLPEPRLDATLPPPLDERTLPGLQLPSQPDAIAVGDVAKTTSPRQARPRAALAAALGCVTLLAAAAAWWYGGHWDSGDAVAPAAVQTPPPTVPTPTPSPVPDTRRANPTPAPVDVEPVTPPSPPPSSPSTETASAPAAVLEPSPAPSEPVVAAPVTPSKAKPAPSPRPAPARNAPPTNAEAVHAKCSDILQKASLEPLTASEAAFLRKECR
ncbi:MAG TPA: serine/threonine-protein kinase [Burkholderiaceae bacterium]